MLCTCQLLPGCAGQVTRGLHATLTCLCCSFSQAGPKACAGLTKVMRHAASVTPCGLQMSTPEEEAAARAELCRTWEEDNWTAEQIQNCLQVNRRNSCYDSRCGGLVL